MKLLKLLNLILLSISISAAAQYGPNKGDGLILNPNCKPLNGCCPLAIKCDENGCGEDTDQWMISLVKLGPPYGKPAILYEIKSWDDNKTHQLECSYQTENIYVAATSKYLFASLRGKWRPLETNHYCATLKSDDCIAVPIALSFGGYGNLQEIQPRIFTALK